MVAAAVVRWPISRSDGHSKIGHSYRGVAWAFDFDTEEAAIVSYKGDGKIEVTHG